MPQAKFGLDVIALVGSVRYRQHLHLSPPGAGSTRPSHEARRCHLRFRRNPDAYLAA